MLYFKKILNSNSKEWCVFIHGAGGSSSIWHKQVKAYSENFNLLLIDLRGHGKSKDLKTSKNYSFEMIAQDVIEVVEFNKIPSAHFIGVSLGTIIIYQIFALKPSIVKSMIFSGAITRLNIKSRLLLRIGRILNPFLPYMTLYTLLARIIMPKKNHKTSRILFINEAKKLNIKRLSLETGAGEFFLNARKLFSKCGFEPCEPFSHYKKDINSIYMTMLISNK